MPVSSCRCVLLDVMSGTVLRLCSLKDTSASSWLFDFVSYFLARYKNENNGIFDVCMTAHHSYNNINNQLDATTATY